LSSDVLRQTEEFAAGSYVELRTCEVPYGWTNHPGYLGIVYFTSDIDNIKTELKADHNIPDARPVLSDMRDTYLLDGGDGKYYFWNEVCESVARIEEPSLQKILAKLGTEGVSGIKYTILTE
jgi:hypothetical protein